MKQTTVPRDPWNNDYVLERGEIPPEFVVLSYGADGEPDTGDEITSDGLGR